MKFRDLGLLALLFLTPSAAIASASSPVSGKCKVKYTIKPDGQIEVTCEQNTCTNDCALLVDPDFGGSGVAGYRCPCTID